MASYPLNVITIPSNYGNPRHPGTEQAPAVLIAAMRTRGWDINEISIEVPPIVLEEDASKLSDMLTALTAIEAISEQIAETVRDVANDYMPFLILGGDHSISISTLRGLNENYPQPKRWAAPAIIWVDAHADIHSPQTTESGHVHGMPVYYGLTEDLINPSNFAFLGQTAVDDDEYHAFKYLHNYPYSIIEKDGIDSVIRRLDMLMHNSGSTHISLDIDAFAVPGSNTPHGKMTKSDSEKLASWFKYIDTTSMEIVEVNPLIESEQTIEFALDIIGITFGFMEFKPKYNKKQLDAVLMATSKPICGGVIISEGNKGLRS